MAGTPVGLMAECRLDLAQPAAILALDAAGVIALLGEGRTITEEDAVGVIPDLADMLAEFGQDALIVPGRYTDEVLEDLATHAHMVSNGLTGLAGQRGQFALEDVLRVGPLLAPLEQRPVPLQKRLDALADLNHLFDGENRIVQ